MRSQEALRDALDRLRRENEALRTEVTHAGTLLDALASLLLIDTREDPFVHVFNSLQAVFSFERAAAFTEESPGELICIAASRPENIGCYWHAKLFLNRVLGGRVSATFDTKSIEEYNELPDTVPRDRPALFMPLRVAGKRGLLAMVKPAGEPGYDRKDVELAKKFGLLASHAMAACDARKQIEQNEIRAGAAEQANRAKSEFLAGMSHELRTPLNAILGFSEVIAQECFGPVGSERYKEYAGDIHSSGVHLLSLINDLLDVGKIEAGKMEISPHALDAKRAFDIALKLVGTRAREKNQHLTISVAADAPALYADERALKQILINLVSNAVKYTHEGGTIAVTGEATEGGGFLICCEDNGPGIPAEKLDKLFKPFSQVDNRFNRQAGGTGLGLSLVRGLAELHGGRAWLESEYGCGCRAFVVLPAAPSAEQAA
jgi:signal transduction histidine kinase